MTALLASLCALLIAGLLAVPGAAASPRNPRKAQPETTEEKTPEAQASAQCQNHDRPPPPIDTSEEPKPGQPSPQPLPVPAEPVGGTRMGECGLVVPQDAPDLPGEVSAASWVVADLDSGDVLAAKDPHARERPASLIKALLAIVVIRELRPDQVVVGTADDANQEGTRVGIGAGGRYTVRELLHALVMRSGNDVAHALARELGGVETALEKMNALARELGAFDTRAATPSGLDGPGMSTSAYDIGLVFRAAMRHREFAEAIGTRTMEFPGFGGKPAFKIQNDNRLMGRYRGFLGGKTGFTDDARHTYLGSAERGDKRIVVVLLRGEPNPAPLADQAAKLLDFGFALAEDETRPVGELVDSAPEVQPKQDGSLGSAPAGGETGPTGPDQAAAQAPVLDAKRSAFGTYGVPLVVAAGVAVLVAFALWLRRTRARRARTRTSAI